MALSSDESVLIARHERRLAATAATDELMERYYRGRQRVEQLGMAIPPEMRRFLVVANWPRVVVDTINARQQMRSMMIPGEDTADPTLEAALSASNFPAHLSMFNLCRLIYGRALMSVGANEDDRSLPLVRAESPREMSAITDTRKEIVTSACRFYADDADESLTAPLLSTQTLNARHATLYLPNATVWCDRDGTGQWVEVERDDHRLGVVPVVVHLNRRMPGQLVGESQMSDVIPFADAAARSLTNMQFAQEAHGIPRVWVMGLTKAEMTGADGKLVPQFEAYFDVINAVANAAGKVFQVTAADLKNFATAMDVYGTQASIVSGFPARLFGLHPANPPAEGAIHADESTLNRSVEQQNEDVGVTLGKVGALAYRFATNAWPDGQKVNVDWFDPATPTVSQREDALAKRRAAGVLSREGYWDELGWSEPRKAKERAYFAAEEADSIDPYLKGLALKSAPVTPDGTPAVAPAGG